MTWRIPAAAAAVLLLPGPNWLALDGLPVSSAPELIGLLALVLVLASREARESMVRWLDRAPFGWRTFGGAIAVGLALKLVLLATVSDTGFAGCYQSPAGSPPGCEASYENPLGRAEATRLDRELDFGPTGTDSADLVDPSWLIGGLRAGMAATDWNLGFINQRSFNLYVTAPGDGLTQRLPLAVTWRGELDRATAGRARVRYTGQGEFFVLGHGMTRLAPAYDQARVATIPLPAGRSEVEVRYRFDNGYRLGVALAPGPWAQLRVVDAATGTPLRAAGPGAAPRAGGIVADVAGLALVVLALVGGVAGLLAGGAWRIAALGAAFGCLGLVLGAPLGGPSGALFVLGPAAVLLALLLGGRRAGEVSGAVAGLLALATMRSLAALPSLDAVIYRRPGSDWLTYEGFARTMLRSGSLEAGEPVFYYQPGFRYLGYALHSLLGDGDVLAGIVAVTAVWAAVTLSVRWLVRSRGLAGSRAVAPALAGAAALLVVAMPDVVAFVRIGISEYWTWILMPIVLALVLGPPTNRRFVLAAGLAGTIFFVRSNQAPALGLLSLPLAAMWWRRSPRTLAVAAAVGLAFVALMPLHNLVYGGDAEFLPTSGSVPGQQALPPGDLTRVFSDRDIAAKLEDQVRLLLFLKSPTLVPRQQPAVLALAFHVALAAWLLALLAVLVRWRAVGWGVRLAVFWPLALLLPYIVFDPRSAYPRHITVAYVAMGIVAAHALSALAPSVDLAGVLRRTAQSVRRAWRRGVEHGSEPLAPSEPDPLIR